MYDDPWTRELPLAGHLVTSAFLQALFLVFVVSIVMVACLVGAVAVWRGA